MGVFNFVSFLPRQYLFGRDLFFTNILKLLTRLYGKHLLTCILRNVFNTNKLRLICAFAILSLFMMPIQEFHILNFEVVCLLLNENSYNYEFTFR